MSLKMLSSMTLLISLGASLPVPFRAQSSVATEAYDQGQYGTAYQLARSLAEQGDVEAQVLLGRMFAWGRGVPRDQAEAVKWFRKAAEQGHGLAQSILGLRYAYGRGVPQDDSQAIEWFRRGTKRGNAVAQHNLGVMYENGKGIAKDDKQAAYWYRLAAEQGGRRVSLTHNPTWAGCTVKAGESTRTIWKPSNGSRKQLSAVYPRPCTIWAWLTSRGKASLKTT